MTLRPCLDCGQPCTGPRCTEHTIDTKADATIRGYDAAWKGLSKRARRLQPFCVDCGSTDDLQADHSPEAWQRRDEGKPLRLNDIDVVCGPCNRRRGAARGALTRGDAPNGGPGHPAVRPNSRVRS